MPLLAPHAAAVQACVGELRQCLASLGSLARQELAVDAAADLVLSLVRAPGALPVILPPNRTDVGAQQWLLERNTLWLTHTLPASPTCAPSVVLPIRRRSMCSSCCCPSC